MTIDTVNPTAATPTGIRKMLIAIASRHVGVAEPLRAPAQMGGKQLARPHPCQHRRPQPTAEAEREEPGDQYRRVRRPGKRHEQRRQPFRVSTAISSSGRRPIRSIRNIPHTTPASPVSHTSALKPRLASGDNAPTVRSTYGAAMVESGPEMQFRKNTSAVSQTRRRHTGPNSSAYDPRR